MAPVAGIVQTLVMILVNATITALMTRFFRVRLATSWGPIVFAVVLIPAVLLVLTQAMSAGGLGFDMGNPAVVIGLLIVVPFVLGVAFDYFWMPDPDDVTLPEEY